MGNLADHAKSELAFIGLREDSPDKMDKLMYKSIMEMVNIFAAQGHSGFSAAYALGILEKVLNFEPVSPLTGEDSEWVDVSETIGRKAWQNKRCSRVIKEEDGTCYDVEGKIFVGPDNAAYTNRDSWVEVKFPYTPNAQFVKVDKNGGEIYE